MPVEVLLIREGSKLAAADPISAEIIANIKLRETVTASIRRPRNPKHHRKLWALLSVVFENQTAFATIEDLLGAIKLATGLFDTGKTVDGIPYVVPQSISFAAMDQNRFEQWYDKALDVILTKIVPGIAKSDLEARINDILNGYSS
jgi:hypothetical protein